MDNYISPEPQTEDHLKTDGKSFPAKQFLNTCRGNVGIECTKMMEKDECNKDMIILDKI